MRIVVLSDSHRSRSNLFEAVEMHLKDADLFIFLGDGEDDFDEVLTAHPNIRYERVSGNCDWGSQYPASKVIEFNGKRVFFTHGHPYYVKHGVEMIKQGNRLHRISNRSINFFGVKRSFAEPKVELHAEILQVVFKFKHFICISKLTQNFQAFFFRNI